MKGVNVNWINVTRDCNQWQAFVNIAMIFGFHRSLGISRSVERLMAYETGSCYMEYNIICGRLNVSLPHAVQIGVEAHRPSCTTGAKT
jgi:hypothetical protein